ncbi:MAG: hypothetical protein ACKO4Z_03015, partial [Planctomycetota bacterium]
DAVVLIGGSIDRRAGSEETNLIVNDVVPIAEAWNLQPRGVTVRLDESLHDRATLDRLAEVVTRHPGKVPLRLVLDLADGSRVFLDVDRDRVCWGQELYRDLLTLLGPSCVRAPVSIGGRRDEPARRGPPGRAPAAVG